VKRKLLGNKNPSRHNLHKEKKKKEAQTAAWRKSPSKTGVGAIHEESSSSGQREARILGRDKHDVLEGTKGGERSVT